MLRRREVRLVHDLRHTPPLDQIHASLRQWFRAAMHTFELATFSATKLPAYITDTHLHNREPNGAHSFDA
jgi:hypothetical protein